MARTPVVVFGVLLALTLGAESRTGVAAPLAGNDTSLRAQDELGNEDPGRLRSAVRRASRQVAIADPDRDGVVTRDEAQAFQDARFGRMDTDRDGAVSLQEFLAEGAGTVATGWPVAFRTGPQTDFEAVDLDGDGTLSREEFLRAAIEQKGAGLPDRVAKRRAIFAALDADGDGRVAREEYMAAAARQFARVDKEGAGALTLWDFLTRVRF